jgi:hypothetical protein
MAKKEARIVVGQIVWYVPREARLGPAHAAKVLTVGKKWAELEGVRSRIDIKTLEAESAVTGLSPGKCYLSHAEHAAQLALEDSWKSLRQKVEHHTWRAPPGVTLEQIEQATRILFPPTSAG